MIKMKKMNRTEPRHTEATRRPRSVSSDFAIGQMPTDKIVNEPDTEPSHFELQVDTVTQAVYESPESILDIGFFPNTALELAGTTMSSDEGTVRENTALLVSQ